MYNTQPSTSILHSILPSIEGGTLSYTFSTTINSNAFLPALTVEIWINSAKLYEYNVNGYDTRTAASGNYTYTYDLEISDFVSSFFDFDNFHNKKGIYQNANLRASLQVKIYVWSPDADGILTKGSSSENSNTVIVLPALKSDLSAYKATSLRKFLTNEPKQSVIFLTKSKFLPLYLDAYTEYIRVRTYDNSNTLVNTYTISFTNNFSIAIICMATTANATMQIGSTAIDLSDVKFFKLDVGSSNNDGINTETREYYIFDYDAYLRIKELSFVNQFGFQDTFFLMSDQHATSFSTQYETYQKRNVGYRIINGTTTKAIDISLRSLDNEDFAWLNDIRKSSRFYIDNTECIANSQTGIIEAAENKNDIDLKLTYSLIQKTHSN